MSNSQQPQRLCHAEHGLLSVSSSYAWLSGAEAVNSFSTQLFLAMPSLGYRELQHPHPISLTSRHSRFQASFLDALADLSVMCCSSTNKPARFAFSYCQRLNMPLVQRVGLSLAQSRLAAVLLQRVS